jgi:toxin-antitoxin system PIN domain toxin
MTQQGFLRLATNPSVFGKHALSLTEAWQKYDLLQSDAYVSFVDEPPGIEPLWRVHTQTRMFSPKVWNDAYLAAFAQASSFELVTIDQGFSHYRNVRCKILS